ncbi:hypothetical protein JTB14_022501 [Gonioctena quinquepunctata]|nr:hypothetical protein JTB14_022501 [Gonioctena quinquepunctata]
MESEGKETNESDSNAVLTQNSSPSLDGNMTESGGKETNDSDSNVVLTQKNSPSLEGNMTESGGKETNESDSNAVLTQNSSPSLDGNMTESGGKETNDSDSNAVLKQKSSPSLEGKAPLDDDTLPVSEDTLPLLEDSSDETPVLEDTASEGNHNQCTFPESTDVAADKSEEEESPIDKSGVDESTPSIDDSLNDTTPEVISKETVPLKSDKTSQKDETEISKLDPPKSSIRLVDLNKLIDPKPRKSVKFDSSVIILTSSDEESPSSTKKKNHSPDPTLLRSALKTSALIKEEGSDSETCSKKEKHSKSKKNKRGGIDHSERVISLDSEKENSESDEDPKISRRSSRLKDVEKREIKNRAKLRKIFKRSEDSSLVKDTKRSKDIKTEKMKTGRTLRKVKPVIEVLSDTSSTSEVEDSHKKSIERKSKSKSRKRDEKDKFGRKVLTNLKTLRRAKRTKDESSSDKEKPLKKKAKSKSGKAEDSEKADSFSSDDNDDEPISVSTEKMDEEPAENGDEILAQIALEQINSEDKEGSEEDVASDNEEKGKKSKKKTRIKSHKEQEEEVESNKDDESDSKEKSEESDEKKVKAKSKGASDSDTDNESKSKSKKKDEDEKQEESEDKENKSDSEQEKDKKKGSSGDDSSDSGKKDKKKWKNDKLLTQKLDSSDDEGDFGTFCAKKGKTRDALVSKAKKRIKKTTVLSDSDESDGAKKKKKDSSSNEDESESEKSKSDHSSDEESGKEETKKKRRRKRIRGANSSSSEEDKTTRKQIRRVLDRDSLSETTKKAEAEEKERKSRIAEKQKKYNNIFEERQDAKIDKLVLDHDEKTKEELLEVNKKIAKKLKPHQANGIQFMWDACFESVERAKKDNGSGCILAHCMGLGKTLQVVALAHTLLTNSKKTKVTKVLVVCPLSTVLNWKCEFKKWVPSSISLEVYELVSCKKNYERQHVVNEWHEEGGVLIISYAMFRNLSNPDNKKISKKLRTVFQTGFVDPGPDLVVCDEGHLLKNEKTNLSISMNRIKTARRIVLTGTPLQNNLKEYWCMVQFIKPNLLGTYKEYMNRFVNPITNGQYTDSTPRDIVLMRKRSHVLHKLLDGVVQRRDYAVLEPYLPPKHEYVLFVKLTEVQVKIYKHYMEKYARQNDGSNRMSFLFIDFQKLQRICTHPRVLAEKGTEKERKSDDEEEESEGSLKDFIDDGEESSSGSSPSRSSGSDSDRSKGKSKKKQQKVRLTRAQAAHKRENGEDSDPELTEVTEAKKEWWQEYCDGEELDKVDNSSKLFLLFEVLKECEEIGDKILIFSQSLYTLNCIEYFLDKIDEATQNGTPENVGGRKGSWTLGLDYFRLDGSSSCDNRQAWCDVFNDPNNIRARLFLISTKAGGLGINLVAANRVIIFDVSWNPSHDLQSIYRIYRFGQTKPCYVYRFVTYGTMEMKIYERQVTKQAISKRVIDEQQIDRHYNQNDLQELYKCDLEPEERPIPMVPKDILLGEMLQKHENTIFKYHLHQSLLENKTDEGLNEEERKAAWEEFENEKVLRKTTFNTGNMQSAVNQAMNAQTIAAALGNIVRRDNPNWSEVQIKGIIPALVQQLQVQLAENDTTMYGRVLQEIQLMRAQKMREAYYQNQMMKLIQQQQKQQSQLGNLSVNPTQLAQMYGTVGNFFTGTPSVGGAMNLANRSGVNIPKPGSSSSRPRSNDVIELND